MTSKHMKRQSISTVLREIQIRATERCAITARLEQQEFIKCNKVRQLKLLHKSTQDAHAPYSIYS